MTYDIWQKIEGLYARDNWNYSLRRSINKMQSFKIPLLFLSSLLLFSNSPIHSYEYEEDQQQRDDPCQYLNGSPELDNPPFANNSAYLRDCPGGYGNN